VKSVFLKALLLVLPAAVGAQTPPTTTVPAGPDSSTKATAVRATRSPVIDGRESDEVWSVALATSDFREFSPKEGGTPRFKTEFKAAYDDRNLFVFVRMHDPQPDSIMRALSRRDVRGASDQIKLMIDSYFDRRNGYEFAVNPDGVKRDYAMYNDRDEDDSWDAVWDVATRIDSAGWTAEFRIPFSQMRYANRASHTFGFAIWRDIERYKERTSWPTYLSSRNGLTSQLGRLEGINGIGTPTRLEVTPYHVTKSSSRTLATNPDRFDRISNGTMGADVKYGITPNLTLDATVNPDFGQVEADPSVLNLTAFETFFQEKRPFFVEGVGLYSFGVNCNVVNCGGEGLFYSRRIGRAPSRSYGVIGAATATPILGAGKLTGRFRNGLSIGVLQAVTDKVETAPDLSASPDDRTMEPMTSYTVARLQQEFRGGGTTVGVIGTGVNRKLDTWTEDLLRESAYVGGADLRHKFGSTGYELNASAMYSQVSGTAQVISNTQLNTTHNYLRPDADLGYDPTATSLTGHAEEIKFAKFGGGVTRFETSLMRRSPGFEINDLGFMRRADEQQQATWFALQFRKPNKVFRSLQMNFNEWLFWNTSGLKTDMGFNTNWHMNSTNNFWWHLGGTITQLGAFCDACTRGGPTIRRSPNLNFFSGVNFDDRWRVTPHVFFGGGRGDYGASKFWWFEPSIEARPSSATQLSLGLSFGGTDDDSQFFGRYTDGTGTHYTFAALDQHTTSLNTRLSYTMTPTLTLQVYAAPFMTKGTYANVRETSATPRADDYEARYTPYTPPAGTSMGFNFKQMRSNTVVRWEYRPGSTLFAVWTHGREASYDTEGTRSIGQEYDDLFRKHPDNTFLLKVAYWLSR
jgi:hypothetical protein